MYEFFYFVLQGLAVFYVVTNAAMVFVVFGRSNLVQGGFIGGSLMGTSMLKASSRIVVQLAVRGVEMMGQMVNQKLQFLLVRYPWKSRAFGMV